jgi:hypothetical protein
MNNIIQFLDDSLTRIGRASIDPVEANALLAKAGLLKDNKDRPGKPLRDLLRKGKLPQAYQSGGKGSSWIIPHSGIKKGSASNYSPPIKRPAWKIDVAVSKPKAATTIDTSSLKKQLEEARLKYKPGIVKYLLIEEAPPDSIDRFFYYENVHKHDDLFLGVAQALYPRLKEKFLVSRRNRENHSAIKESILLKLKNDGFYLLDLSELPLSLMRGDLDAQLPWLIEKISKTADKQTKIILIKATVYDTAFLHLQEEFENVVDVRIPFPGQGGQKLFQTKFKEALKLSAI